MAAAAFNPLRIASVPKHEEHDAAHEARGPMQARFNPYDFNGGCVPRGTGALLASIQRCSLRALPSQLTAVRSAPPVAAPCSPSPALITPLSLVTRA